MLLPLLRLLLPLQLNGYLFATAVPLTPTLPLLIRDGESLDLVGIPQNRSRHDQPMSVERMVYVYAALVYNTKKRDTASDHSLWIRTPATSLIQPLL